MGTEQGLACSRLDTGPDPEMLLIFVRGADLHPGISLLFREIRKRFHRVLKAHGTARAKRRSEFAQRGLGGESRVP